jgi:hypothetical protein
MATGVKSMAATMSSYLTRLAASAVVADATTAEEMIRIKNKFKWGPHSPGITQCYNFKTMHCFVVLSSF